MLTTEQLESLTEEDLIRFLLATLGEEEAIALKASNRRWLETDNIISLWPEREDDGHMGWPTRSDARHAARQDPSRTLRRIKAERALVRDFPKELHVVVEDSWYTCPAATGERDGGESSNTSRTGMCDCGRNDRVLRHLRLLALPYIDFSLND